MLTQKLVKKQVKQVYGFLHWTEGSHIEQREIDSFISLGRDKDNIISLDDGFTSRRHCRIQKKADEGFLLLDMNSRNGTFLNGNRVYKALLKNNDRIQIGKKEFTFSYERFETHWNMHTQSKNTNWKTQLNNLQNMATSEMPVLITGPSGTGKEMLAKLIHRYSRRSSGPMVSVNCSALSESLVESEFFGHIKGSYTGALTNRKGAFLAATGGSLFLDEIGDLPINLQPKLLRAIEYQEIKPVGSDETIKTNVRVIAATHQNLPLKIVQNTFRSDLYFRLNVLSLKPPALKDRMEDFEELLGFFCSKYQTGFSAEAIHTLKNHHWPGNIRELKNTIARAKALYPEKSIDTEQVLQLLDPHANYSINDSTSYENNFNTSKSIWEPLDISSTSIKTQGRKRNGYFMEKVERDILTKYLTLYSGNQVKVSESLNIPRSTLSVRLKHYNIDPRDFKPPAR